MADEENDPQPNAEDILNRLLGRNDNQQQLREERVRRMPNVPGNTQEERIRLRRIRMQCIQLRREENNNGLRTYIFHCQCCDSEFRSPFRWGGNRKTSHADRGSHQRNFVVYARQHDIAYLPQNLVEDGDPEVAPARPPGQDNLPPDQLADPNHEDNAQEPLDNDDVGDVVVPADIAQPQPERADDDDLRNP